MHNFTGKRDVEWARIVSGKRTDEYDGYLSSVQCQEYVDAVFTSYRRGFGFGLREREGEVEGRG